MGSPRWLIAAYVSKWTAVRSSEWAQGIGRHPFQNPLEPLNWQSKLLFQQAVRQHCKLRLFYSFKIKLPISITMSTKHGGSYTENIHVKMTDDYTSFLHLFVSLWDRSAICFFLTALLYLRWFFGAVTACQSIHLNLRVEVSLLVILLSHALNDA